MIASCIKIVLCFTIVSLVAHGQDGRPIPKEEDRPALKESPEALVGLIDWMAGENVAAARVNIAHDVAHKRLRIFSISPNTKTGEFKEFGYALEIIYSRDIASQKSGVGSYRFQSNYTVLSFAAAQYVSGEKAFARRLVSILAEAEPDLFWSSPTDRVISIKEILTGLENDDASVRPFLAHCSSQWSETIKKCGP